LSRGGDLAIPGGCGLSRGGDLPIPGGHGLSEGGDLPIPGGHGLSEGGDLAIPGGCGLGEGGDLPIAVSKGMLSIFDSWLVDTFLNSPVIRTSLAFVFSVSVTWGSKVLNLQVSSLMYSPLVWMPIWSLVKRCHLP